MPFDTNRVPERLIQAARDRVLVPLVGAGVSRQAGYDFPSWKGLLETVKVQALNEGRIPQGDVAEFERLIAEEPLMAAEALRYILPTDEWFSLIQKQFQPEDSQPAEAHKELISLNPPLILTTNYDTLLEDAYAEKYRRIPQVMSYKDAAAVQKHIQSGRFRSERPIIFKMHGTVGSEIVLSASDYRRLVSNEPGYRIVLSAIFVQQVVLMLGFSFSDPELRLLLEEIRDSLKRQSPPDYIFLGTDEAGPVQERRLREDYGLQIIPYEPTPEHPELRELIKYLVEQTT